MAQDLVSCIHQVRCTIELPIHYVGLDLKHSAQLLDFYLARQSFRHSDQLEGSELYLWSGVRDVNGYKPRGESSRASRLRLAPDHKVHLHFASEASKIEGKSF